jgi:hypothetical protein
MTAVKRYALITWTANDTAEQIRRYLPSNYALVGDEPIEYHPHPEPDADETTGCLHWLIEGHDDYGWTLDGYVIPRLASGLHWAKEIDLSHAIMKSVPSRRPRTVPPSGVRATHA